MEKSVLAAANCYTQKYFFNAEYNSLPDRIQVEIRIMITLLSEKLHCIFLIGLSEQYEIYFETRVEGYDPKFDEIGAELEIKRIRAEQKELLQSLNLWAKYLVEGGKQLPTD